MTAVTEPKRPAHIHRSTLAGHPLDAFDVPAGDVADPSDDCADAWSV